MPFIPHTDEDIKEMLSAIGISAIDTLFDEIPDSLRHVSLANVPPRMSEMELTRIACEHAKQDEAGLCFIGAGAYEHHIPAAVWEIATRGEFMTAYTPYQPEASQGSLQLIYEYQSMMASLMALEVSNASLYDGASALAEAMLMAVRLSPKKKHPAILMPKSIHPHYQQVAKTILSQQAIQLIEINYDAKTGRVDVDHLEQSLSDEVVAFVIPQPNFFGVIEEVDLLTDWARAHQLIPIAVVNPIAMALLKPPGEWGAEGVDIACGEGQPLGIPLASGGPYYGFLCGKKSQVRQMPGRIVGRTIDREGKTGYVLTLQAREQHIRRGKATSNICTNQGLMVTASTIYMSLMGPQGLRQVALLSHQRARAMREKLLKIPGVKTVFSSPFFHELLLQFDQPVMPLLRDLAKKGIQAGYALDQTYPELKNTLLIAATETKQEQDLQLLAEQLGRALKQSAN